MSLAGLVLALGLASENPGDIALSESMRHVYARVNISAEGRVEKVVIRNKMVPEVESNLRRRIEGWVFDPAKQHDVAVRSTTTVHLSIQLAPNADGGANLEIIDVRNGPEPVRMVSPEYSTRQARAGMKGGVLVRCRVNRKGRCVDANIESVTAPPALASSALSAIKAWRFEPEYVAGEPIETWILMPFCFAPPEELETACTSAERKSLAALDSPVHLRQEMARNSP